MTTASDLARINLADQEVDRSLSASQMEEKITECLVRAMQGIEKGDFVSAGSACTSGKNYFMALRRRCRAGNIVVDDPLAGIALGEGVKWGGELRYVRAGDGFKAVADLKTNDAGEIVSVYVNTGKTVNAKIVKAEFEKAAREADEELEVTSVTGFRCFVGRPLTK